MDLGLRYRNVSTPAGHQWIEGTPDAVEVNNTDSLIASRFD
jgi:hypothetical protein